MEQKIRTIALNKLVLWTENPRDPVSPELSDRDIILRAIDNESGNWDLDKMLADIGKQYYYNQIPTVVPTDGGKYVVYDGNRRVAVLKCLQDPELYQLATNRLPVFPAPEALLSQTSLPCNVCDRDTALDIVEKNHAGSKRWGRLQFEQFEHYHRGKPKGRLMILDEATGGEVGRNRNLNEEYMQNRLLTDANLSSVGLAMVDGELRSSLGSREEAEQVIRDIVDVKDKKLSSARKNPGDLLGALRELDPKRYGEPKAYDPDGSFSLTTANALETASDRTDMGTSPDVPSKKRKKPVPKRTRSPLFGEALRPSGNQPNMVYRAIEWMWEQYCMRPDKLAYLLPIMGFSLRLLLECVAREYFRKTDPDKDLFTGALVPFINNVVKKDLRKSGQKTLLTNQSIGAVLLDTSTNIQGILHNWAHGTIDVDETSLTREATILAEIIRRYGE